MPAGELCRPEPSPTAQQALAAALELTRRLGQEAVPELPVEDDLMRFCSARLRLERRRRSLLLAFDESDRLVSQRGVPDIDTGELSRLVLEAALDPRVVRFVPVLFGPSSLVLAPAWSEMLAGDVSEILSRFGVRLERPRRLDGEEKRRENAR